jgi:hypothetical protein
MRRCLLLLGLYALSTSAAEARTDARQLTCPQVQAMNREQGAAVLTTGQYTYERFVSDYRLCNGRIQTRPARTATRDDPSCWIGYVCRPPPDRD